MDICLFGGAFDPPHIGHQQVADSLLEHKVCEEVWYVPVKQHPFGKEIRTNGHREEMLKLILKPHMRIEEYELNHPGKSFSYDTLDFLSQKYPEHNFAWVIGSDNLKDFPKWKKFKDLIEKYQVYVYPREGHDFSYLLERMTPLISFAQVKASSTDIRERIEGGKPLTGLVDPKIEEYIKAHKLYR